MLWLCLVMNQGRYLKQSRRNVGHSSACEPFPVGSGLKDTFLSRKNYNPREELPYLDVAWLVGSASGSYFRKPAPDPFFTDQFQNSYGFGGLMQSRGIPHGPRARTHSLTLFLAEKTKKSSDWLYLSVIHQPFAISLRNAKEPSDGSNGCIASRLISKCCNNVLYINGSNPVKTGKQRGRARISWKLTVPCTNRAQMRWDKEKCRTIRPPLGGKFKYDSSELNRKLCRRALGADRAA
jgi:hypothetical protein